jgi:hypothetical protein
MTGGVGGNAVDSSSSPLMGEEIYRVFDNSKLLCLNFELMSKTEAIVAITRVQIR